MALSVQNLQHLFLVFAVVAAGAKLPEGGEWNFKVTTVRSQAEKSAAPIGTCWTGAS